MAVVARRRVATVNPTLDDLLRAAEAEAMTHYLNAVAGELEGLSDDEAWRRVGIVLARQHVLSTLLGMQAATAAVVRAGGTFEFDQVT